MGKLMEDIISTANRFAANMREEGVDVFDFSIESLAEADSFLGSFEGDDLDTEALFNASSMVGCYIFETARQNYGGEYYWLENEQQPILIAGEPDFSVSIRAWQKAKGRILNGSEDNIPFYIEGYKEHIEKGKETKGYCVTIV
ncbi:MAG: hypothetical protein NC092_11010 [Butyrivibrio sp.]|nr:hypothetical protein [Muribaculum sp.]MCM1553210.1 hypothetical protein [Butyrivibrio sp.]